MTDIILSTQNGEPVASSRQIAESFGKEHKDVLRAIENIKAQNCALTSMFFETTYTAGTGKAYPMYLMNRDGFTLLAMGFTGKAALEWKLKYIAAFNAMEKQLAQRPQLTNGNSLQALNLLVKSLNEQQDAMNRLQVNVDAQSAAIEKLEEQNELNRQAFTMNHGNWRENATFHKDMKKRKMNLKKEFPKRKFSNFEVIDRAGDRNQLISILQSVLCKMCIRYGVRLDIDKAKTLTDKPEDSQTSLFDRNCTPAGRLVDARNVAVQRLVDETGHGLDVYEVADVCEIKD